MENLTASISKNRIALLLLFLVAATIPMTIKAHNIAIALSIIFFSITVKWRGQKEDALIHLPVSRFLALQFLIVVVGLTYSINLEEGILDLERSLYLIASLLIVYGIRQSGYCIDDVLNGFTIGNITLTIYGIVALLLKPDSISSSQNGLDQAYTFCSEHLIHPLYLSTYLILIFFFLIEKLRTKWDEMSNPYKYLNLIGAVYTLAIIVLLRAQVSLIILPILLIVYAVVILKKRGWFVAFFFVTIVFLTFLLDSQRMRTFFDLYGKNVSTALDQRISVWNGTLQGIMISPLFGAGTGGDQDLIDKGYEKIGYQDGINSSFNAHNQYLQFIARNGIIELACFLALLGYCFWKSLKPFNHTFLMFNMLVTLVMFTESFLIVQKGITFYYFLACAFLCLPPERVPAKDLKIA